MKTRSIYERASLRGNIKVRKPHVGIADVPLSPKTKAILEENERIINKEKNRRKYKRPINI